MERYRIQSDIRQLIITKCWTAHVASLFTRFWVLLPLLLYVSLMRFGRRPAPPELQMILMGILAIGFSGLGLYALWKIVRGGDSFLFDARKHLFEHNGHVVSHWDGIAQIAIVDVPHRKDRRRRWLVELLNEDEYYYTYRLVIQLYNGKKHALDECGTKETITQLAQDIAAYTSKPVANDIASVAWLG